MRNLHGTVRIILAVTLALAQQAVWATGDVAEYRVERTIPPASESGSSWSFDKAQYMAAAPDGSVWASDTLHDRIQHFKADGSFIAEFGGYPFKENNSFRTHATELDHGQLSHPSGIAVAADGSVWVVDNSFLSHFSSEGGFIDHFRHGHGGNDSPIQLAKDGSIYFLVGDSAITHFNADGLILGDFQSPYVSLKSFTLASDGALWLVNQFGRAEYISANGSSIVDPLGIIYGITAFQFAADGSLWLITSYGDNTIKHLSATGQTLAEFGSKGSANGQFNAPSQITPLADGSVWITDTGNNRFQHLTATGQFITQIKSTGTDIGTLDTAGHFQAPSGIAVATDGSLWVSDKGNKRMQRISATGDFIAQFSTLGNSRGSNDYLLPKVAPTEDGSLWLWSSGSTGRIEHRTADGTFIAGIPYSGGSVNGIAADGKGGIWVTNGNGSLIHYNAIGSQIASNTDIDTVAGISVAADGSVWLAQGGQHTIAHYNADASLIGQYSNGVKVAYGTRGTVGAAPRQFNTPHDIAIAPDGSLWIADTGNNRIQHLNTDGSFIAQYGSLGSGAGQFKGPEGIAVAKEGSVWVVDTGNNRIQKFVAQSSAAADYNDKQLLLSIHDVDVKGVHYQATLQNQNGLFQLLSVNPVAYTYRSPSLFDPVTNLLTLPLVRAFGQDYQASLKRVDNDHFLLQSATLK
ncbi:MAG: NHL repeat-containing protein [Methylococcales bacterium]|nr:NHL repeat-containing protein [Methylococcales bacterium]